MLFFIFRPVCVIYGAKVQKKSGIYKDSTQKVPKWFKKSFLFRKARDIKQKQIKPRVWFGEVSTRHL